MAARGGGQRTGFGAGAGVGVDLIAVAEDVERREGPYTTGTTVKRSTTPLQMLPEGYAPPFPRHSPTSLASAAPRPSPSASIWASTGVVAHLHDARCTR